LEKFLRVIFIVLVLGFATLSAAVGTQVLSEERITTETAAQVYPAIYGDIVVWMDARSGTNYDIWGYNLKTKQEFQITTHTSYQYSPAIYGDIVVWEDNRNGAANYDIWGYNLKTKEEFQITTDTRDQGFPAIYCGRVVWQDYRNVNADIYLANLDVVCETTKHKSLPMAQILKILGLYPKE